MNFFSSILKNKKALFFVFLFVFVFSTFFGIKIKTMEAAPTPEQQAVQACKNACPMLPNNGGPDPDCMLACEGLTPNALVKWLATSPSLAFLDANTSCPGDKLHSFGANNIVLPLLTGIVDVIAYIPKTLAGLSGDLFSAVMGILKNWSITSGKGDGGAPAFMAGWTQVRNLANMLIVLGFVIIGIATSLRIREYEAKKALWPLIIVALLVNFSGLVCGLIIDASQLTMKGLLQTEISGVSGDINLAQRIGKFGTSTLCGIAKSDTFSAFFTYVAVSGQLMFMYLAIALAFFYLDVVLIARYAILGILFILSPVAFAFYAFPFPKAKDLWSKWWNSFLKWAFVGVGISFFLNIAETMLVSPAFKSTIDSGNGTNTFFYILVVLITIVVGIMISVKGSGVVGAAVMGIAKGGVGLALGAVGGVAAVTGLKGLAQRGGQAAQRVATRAGEGLRLIAPGTANLQRQAQQKEHKSAERAETWSADQRRDIATGRAGTTRQRNDKLEAIKQMASKNELGVLSQPERAAAVTYATSHGASASTLAKDDYRAAEFDTGPNGRVTALGGGAIGARRARAEQLETNLSKMSGQQRRNIDTRDITPEFITSPAMNAGVIRDFRTANAAHIAQFGAPGVGVPGTPGAMHVAVDTQLTNRENAAIASNDTNEQRRLANIRNEINRTLQAP